MKISDIAATLLVVLIWGFNFVAIKIGLQSLPPMFFTALRFLFAAIPMVFFLPRLAVVVALHLEARATVIGFMLAIAAGLSWDVRNIFTKPIGTVDALALSLVAWGSLLAALLLLIVSLLFEEPQRIGGATQPALGESALLPGLPGGFSVSASGPARCASARPRSRPLHPASPDIS